MAPRTTTTSPAEGSDLPDAIGRGSAARRIFDHRSADPCRRRAFLDGPSFPVRAPSSASAARRRRRPRRSLASSLGLLAAAAAAATVASPAGAMANAADGAFRRRPRVRLDHLYNAPRDVAIPMSPPLSSPLGVGSEDVGERDFLRAVDRGEREALLAAAGGLTYDALTPMRELAKRDKNKNDVANAAKNEAKKEKDKGKGKKKGKDGEVDVDDDVATTTTATTTTAAATDAPTSSPTENPTKNPTRRPTTLAPTTFPTRTPTTSTTIITTTTAGKEEETEPPSTSEPTRSATVTTTTTSAVDVVATTSTTTSASTTAATTTTTSSAVVEASTTSPTTLAETSSTATPTSSSTSTTTSTTMTTSSTTTTTTASPSANEISLGLSVALSRSVAADGSDGGGAIRNAFLDGQSRNDRTMMNAVEYAVTDELRSRMGRPYSIGEEDGDEVVAQSAVALMKPGGRLRLRRRLLEGSSEDGRIADRNEIVQAEEEPTLEGGTTSLFALPERTSVETSVVSVAGSDNQLVWRSYELWYRIESSKSLTKGTRKTPAEVKDVARSALGDAVDDGTLLSSLRLIDDDVKAVALKGDEVSATADLHSPAEEEEVASGTTTAATSVRGRGGSYPDPIDTSSFDPTRFCGVLLFFLTLTTTVVLFRLGRRRKIDRERREIWGSVLGCDGELDEVLKAASYDPKLMVSSSVVAEVADGTMPSDESGSPPSSPPRGSHSTPEYGHDGPLPKGGSPSSFMII